MHPSVASPLRDSAFNSDLLSSRRRAEKSSLSGILRLFALSITLVLLVWLPLRAGSGQTGQLPVPTTFPMIIVQIPEAGDGEARFQSLPFGRNLAFSKEAVEIRVRARSLRMTFHGANPDVRIQGEQSMSGRVHLFKGNDPSRWRKNIPTFSGVSYRGLYRGVDLSFSGGQDILKGTYSVAPGADPGAIRWSYTGARQLELDASSGALLIQIGAEGECLLEKAPTAWQEEAGRQRQVAISYRLEEGGSVLFNIGEYDPTKILFIDPALTYSGIIGGTGNDEATAIAVDSAGSAYVVGSLMSRDFPLLNSYQAPHSGGVARSVDSAST